MGQGIISVSRTLFEPYEPMVDGMSTTEKDYIPPALPQTLAEWHSFLLLPDEFRLLEVRSDEYCYALTVEHKAIPVVKGKLPEVTLLVTRKHNEKDGTSTTYLEKVEVHMPTGETPMEAIKKRKDPSYISSLIERRHPVIWQRSEQ